MLFVSERLSIGDVFLLRPRRHLDARGYFVETYRKSLFTEARVAVDFIQDNEALSRDRGTLRGLHFQLAPSPQAKLVRVIAGAIFDVAVDLRTDSPSFGQWCGTNLTAEDGTQMFIPVGFAHGYCTLEPDTLVAYKVDGYYDKAAEAGIAWNDPDIGIDWPVEPSSIKVSEKDTTLPRLRDAPKPFRFES